MTDYTHVATIAIGVAAIAAGAYIESMNGGLGATLVTVGLAILGYKALTGAPSPTSMPRASGP